MTSLCVCDIWTEIETAASKAAGEVGSKVQTIIVFLTQSNAAIEYSEAATADCRSLTQR